MVQNIHLFFLCVVKTGWILPLQYSSNVYSETKLDFLLLTFCSKHSSTRTFWDIYSTYKLFPNLLLIFKDSSVVITRNNFLHLVLQLKLEPIFVIHTACKDAQNAALRQIRNFFLFSLRLHYQKKLPWQIYAHVWLEQ